MSNISLALYRCPACITKSRMLINVKNNAMDKSYGFVKFFFLKTSDLKTQVSYRKKVCVVLIESEFQCRSSSTSYGNSEMFIKRKSQLNYKEASVTQ